MFTTLEEGCRSMKMFAVRSLPDSNGNPVRSPFNSLALLQNTCQARAGIPPAAALLSTWQTYKCQLMGGWLNQKREIHPLLSSQRHACQDPKGSETKCVGLKLKQLHRLTRRAWRSSVMLGCFHKALKTPGSVTMPFLEDKRRKTRTRGQWKPQITEDGCYE